LVTEDLWAELPENYFAAGADVLLEEMGTFGYVLALATREIIHDDNLVAAGEEMLGHMRANESSTTRQQYTHLKRPLALSLRPATQLRVFFNPLTSGHHLST